MTKNIEIFDGAREKMKITWRGEQELATLMFKSLEGLNLMALLRKGKKYIPWEKYLCYESQQKQKEP